MSDFYVLGGTLTRDAPSYVQRQADGDLFSALNSGRFCYVLTSRQMGKSSLMVRTAVRLRLDGTKIVVIDLTALGQNLTAGQWYMGLLGRMGSQLDLEDELEDFWEQNRVLGPLQRWLKAIRQVVLVKVTGPLVIFIDEIDATRSLPFSTDEFFAGIRELYNERSETPELNRLTFCLLGVATPSDLIQDTRTTPFNIGQRIDLTDFSENEAGILARGLNRPGDLGDKLLRRILYWTGGHPYLTQRLCQAVGEDPTVEATSDVDRVCNDIFLSTKARERDDNLLFVRDRMLRSAVDPAALLTLYAQVLRGSRVKDDPAHPLITVLHLAGVVRADNGHLKIRNRIYQRVFNKDFVAANQPLDEVQRQRAAERRGRLKAFAVAVPIILIFVALSVTAWLEGRQANNQRNEAEKQKVEAQQTALKLEKANSRAEAQTKEAERQKSQAEEQRNEAEKRKTEAERARAEAERARAEAENRKTEADRARTEAETERKNSTRAYQGLSSMFDIGSELRDAAAKQSETSSPTLTAQQQDNLRMYLKTIELTDRFADTVLEHDSKDLRAASTKAYDEYLAADTWRKLKEPDKARAEIAKSIALAQKWAQDTEPRFRVLGARTYAIAALGMFMLDDLAQTKANVEKADQIAQATEANTKDEDAETLHSLALAYNLIAALQFDMEDWDRSIASYTREVNMDQKVYNVYIKTGDGRLYATTHDALDARNKIARIQVKTNQLAAARLTYEQKSLMIANRLLGWNENAENKRKEEEKNLARRDVWDVQDLLGDVLAAQKETRADAVKYYTEAITTGEKLIQSAGTFSNRAKLEDEVSSRAKVQKLLGHPKEAREDYNRFVELVGERAAKEPGPSSASDLAVAFQVRAEFQVHQGDKAAALADYKKSREWLLKANQDSGQVQRRIGIVTRLMADLESGLGNSANAKLDYEQAGAAAEKAIAIYQKDPPDVYTTQRAFAIAYEDLAFDKLGVADRKGADEYLEKALQAARAAVNIAKQALAKKPNLELRNQIVSAYGSLAWTEVLNNHPKEAMQSAQEALNMDRAQPWIHGNLGHAYLLLNQPDKARECYLANRGEEVNGDLFEQSVLEDLDLLRRLGYGRADMAAVEQMMSK
jgi:hypothetical protein